MTDINVYLMKRKHLIKNLENNICNSLRLNKKLFINNNNYMQKNLSILLKNNMNIYYFLLLYNNINNIYMKYYFNFFFHLLYNRYHIYFNFYLLIRRNNYIVTATSNEGDIIFRDSGRHCYKVERYNQVNHINEGVRKFRSDFRIVRLAKKARKFSLYVFNKVFENMKNSVKNYFKKLNILNKFLMFDNNIDILLNVFSFNKKKFYYYYFDESNNKFFKKLLNCKILFKFINFQKYFFINSYNVFIIKKKNLVDFDDVYIYLLKNIEGIFKNTNYKFASKNIILKKIISHNGCRYKKQKKL